MVPPSARSQDGGTQLCVTLWVPTPTLRTTFFGHSNQLVFSCLDCLMHCFVSLILKHSDGILTCLPHDQQQCLPPSLDSLLPPQASFSQVSLDLFLLPVHYGVGFSSVIVVNWRLIPLKVVCAGNFCEYPVQSFQFCPLTNVAHLYSF